MRAAFFGLALTILALGLAATATGGSSSSSAIPGCAKGDLSLLKEGTLTIGGDNPSFPPFYGGAPKKPWKISNPYSGKGYESAVAYAVANQLGFSKSQVAWTPLVWTASFRPGKKPFDIYLAQISYLPERAKNADFSNSYLFLNQSVVANAGTPLASVKTVAGLRPYKFGVTIGTTAYDYVVEHPPLAEAKRLRQPGGRGLGAQCEADRRDRRRLPLGALRDRRAARRRGHRREAPHARATRALRDRAAQGQPEPALRQPGDQPPVGERNDQEASDGVAQEERA